MDKLIRQAVFKYLENNNPHRRFLDKTYFETDPDLFRIVENNRDSWLVLYKEYDIYHMEFERRSFLVEYKQAHGVLIVSEIMSTESYSVDELER